MPEIKQTPGNSQEKDFPYFRRLWNSIVVALLGAAFIPLMLIGGGMYYFSGTALKQKTLESLRAEVFNHKKNVDRFLAERTLDLRQLASTRDLALLTRPGALESLFRTLQAAEEKPWLTDLGIIDDRGRHLAYAGPYDLISQNYKNAPWFKAVMAQGVYVSDVFSGFRQVPHFVIAVKQHVDGKVWIIRATIDTAYFDSLVAGVTAKTGGNAFLISNKGIFQTSPGKAGQLMGQSGFNVPQHFDGIKLKEYNGQLVAMGWLDKVPWLSVVQMDRAEIFRLLHRVRNIGIFVFFLGGIIIVLTVLLTTNHLVQRLETKRKQIRFLDHQLQHTSRMASSMHLSSGFFIEIKDLLINMEMAAQLAHDLVAKDPTRTENLAEIRGTLDQIQSEARSGLKWIDRILTLTRPAAPVILDIDINDLLDELIRLFKRELQFKNIKIIRDYYNQPPPVRSDPSQVNQVFQNLIFNAISAIPKDGTIILQTRRVKSCMRVAVVDNGPGISGKILDKIFEPFYTTSPDGMGLGLSVCRNIIDKLGGTIHVSSQPGKGAAFTVELPFEFRTPNQGKPEPKKMNI